MSDDTDDGDAAFERELASARAMLADGDDVSALYVGVVRGDRANSTTARRSEGEQARLETLTLLASHLRTVADEAGADYDAVAADAARLAGRVDELPADHADGTGATGSPEGNGAPTGDGSDPDPTDDDG